LNRTYSTQAIVLKTKDLGETDRLLTVLSQHYGKLILVAKGVRRPKSRKAGHLQTFNLVKLFMAKTKGIDIITETETIKTFQARCQSLGKTSQACYFAELIDQLEPFEQVNEKLFQLFKQALTQLEKQLLNQTQLFNYVFKIVELLGFGPPAGVKTLPQLENYIQSISDQEITSKTLLREIRA